MKKICIFIVIMCCSILSANAADKLHVVSLTDFSTLKPTEEIDVQLISDSSLGKYYLKANDILHCKVERIINPKRGKRSASFVVSPISYFSDGQENEINVEYSGKYSEKILSKEELKKLDKKNIGKKTAITVGNHFIKGVAPVASLAEGMIKNEDGNRLESGVKQVYKDSALSYIEKGKDLNITKGDSFYLIFKTKKEETSQECEDLNINMNENEI